MNRPCPNAIICGPQEFGGTLLDLSADDPVLNLSAEASDGPDFPARRWPFVLIGDPFTWNNTDPTPVFHESQISQEDANLGGATGATKRQNTPQAPCIAGASFAFGPFGFGAQFFFNCSGGGGNPVCNDAQTVIADCPDGKSFSESLPACSAYGPNVDTANATVQQMLEQKVSNELQNPVDVTNDQDVTVNKGFPCETTIPAGTVHRTACANNADLIAAEIAQANADAQAQLANIGKYGNAATADTATGSDCGKTVSANVPKCKYTSNNAGDQNSLDAQANTDLVNQLHDLLVKAGCACSGPSITNGLIKNNNCGNITYAWNLNSPANITIPAGGTFNPDAQYCSFNGCGSAFCFPTCHIHGGLTSVLTPIGGGVTIRQYYP